MRTSLTQPGRAGRGRNMALLLCRQVSRDTVGRRFDLHVVNIGKASASAASWRMERSGCAAPYVETMVRDLPRAVLPGADILVASVDRSDSRQERVDVILRWAHPSGVVDESLHRFS